MQIFRLSEIDLGAGERELQIEGELDLAVADQLQEALEKIEAERVLIDLSECEFIDSTGIAVVVQAQQRAQADGRHLVVHSPRAQVLRVLAVTGLTGNGLVFEDRRQAAAQFR